MGVTKKHAKGRLDKYYHLAKEMGYRARSAFKLIQLNKKYNFLSSAKALVDLCAAPGGWLQVSQKQMSPKSLIIGIDLVPIKTIPGVITLTEDITTPKCRSSLKKELKGWQVDVFLHDGAPNVGVSWNQDAFTQSELTLSALKLATEFLVPNGTFVTKVFRSKDYTKLLWVFNQFFENVDATKPVSSRNVSAEIFVVCRGYKSPKTIDPKLLDSKYVFKEVDDVSEETDPKKIKERQGAILNDLFHPEKRKRHRDGYADGATTLYSSVSALEFIKSPDFVKVLASSNAIDFPPSEEMSVITSSPHTTSEIVAGCQDLRVLGKREFKGLIKWRDSMRIVLGLVEPSKPEEKVAQELAPMPQTPEEIAQHLREQTEILNNEKKKALRKSRERKAKQLIRLKLGMEAPMDLADDVEMGGIDNIVQDISGDAITTLFNADLAKKAKEKMKSISDSNSTLYLESDSETEEESEESSDEDLDSEEEVAKKIGGMEDDMNELFEDYLQKRLEKDPKLLVKQRSASKVAFEEWYGVEWEKKVDGIDAAKRSKKSGDDDSDSSSSESEDEADDATEEVIDAKDGALSSAVLSRKARVFFDNPLFKDLNPNESKMFGAEIKEKDIIDSSSDEEEIKKAVKNARKEKNSKRSKRKRGNDSDDEKEKGFEIVKMEKTEDDSSNAFVLDTAAKYTMGQQIIHKSGKRDLIDGAFNRFAYNDPDNLPVWFVTDENRHNKPQLPVTQEAVDILKAKLRALDARPIKKVAEAKFRNKLRVQKRVEKMRQQATATSENTELSEQKRLKEAHKIMSKKVKQQKKKTQLVVAKHGNKGVKGRPKGVKGRYKMVDGRLKKEMRSQKRSKKRK